MKKGTEELQYLNGILDRTHDLIARCDQKISITMALLGGFLALFFSGTQGRCANCQVTYERTTVSLVLLMIAFVLCASALVSLAIALFARIPRSKNIEFFSCIRYYDANELKRKLDSYCNQKKYNFLVEEIYANYKIADKKHVFFDIGLCLSVGGILLILISSFC